MVQQLCQEAMLYFLKCQHNSNIIIDDDQTFQNKLNLNKIKMK